MNRILLSMLALALSLASVLCRVGESNSQPKGGADEQTTRLIFARAVNRLKKGMPATEVKRLLGPPGDIRTEHDPGGISTVGTKEVWRYGTSGHLTTATLGQVSIDEKDCVQYVFGQGEPQATKLPDERELRRLLDLLGQVPSYNSGSRYNPRTVIRAVNALLPLGKEKALATIDEFLRVADDDGREGVFLVLRTLFEVPPEPNDPQRLPCFPIAIEGDIPLLLVESYCLGGMPESPEAHVRYFRDHGKLRSRPLVPVAQPFRALDQFARSDRWSFDAKSGFNSELRERHLLGEQLLRLMDTVFRSQRDAGDGLLPWIHGAADTKSTETILAAVSSLKIRWDTESDKYTFLDGTTLPKPKREFYRRETWKPTAAHLDVRLIVERASPRYVSVWFVENYGPDRSARAILNVYDAKAKDRVLTTFAAGEHEIPSDRTGTSSTWNRIELPVGEDIQAELTLGGKSQVGPIMRP